jgi:hypothetical protein
MTEDKRNGMFDECFANETFYEPRGTHSQAKLASLLKRMDVGIGLNPVLILTGRELFGQFQVREFSELNDSEAQLARSLFRSGDMNDLCEFTQKLYLGMPSSHEVRRQTMQKFSLKKQANPNAPRAPKPPS